MAKMGRYVCVGPDVGRRLCMVPTNGAEGTLVTDISLKKVFFLGRVEFERDLERG